MYHNFIGANSTVLLPELLEALLKADEIGSRAGLTKELTHVGITMTQPWQREMLTAGRKPNLAAAIAETMWVLGGREDVEWLQHYLPRAPDFSDDGLTWRGAYGDRLRRWPKNDGSGDVIDQLSYIVDLMKEQVGTRRAVAMIYDPARDNVESKDIPCNNWLSFISRLGKLDLHVAVRSNDAIWGWSGINVFEWSALQEIVAGLLGLQVGGLHFSTTSFHLYGHHFEKARLICTSDTEFMDERLKDSPRFNMGTFNRDVDNLDALIDDWFRVEEEIREQGYSTALEERVSRFPEPMMRSWLQVLQWWWWADEAFLEPLKGTRLWAATKRSVQPSRESEKPAEVDFNPNDIMTWPQKSTRFVPWVTNLHDHKHLAYGNSWKKRGELFSIMPNIGRKVDRLASGGETDDETQVDTASDLLVYLVKYICWLNDEGLGDGTINGILSQVHPLEGAMPQYSDETVGPNAIIAYLDTRPNVSNLSAKLMAKSLSQQYEALLEAVTKQSPYRLRIAYQMADDSFILAKYLWSSQ